MNKRITLFLASLLSVFLLTAGIAQAQVSSPNFWKLVSNVLQPIVATWTLKVPSLGSVGNPCVVVGSTGQFATSTCGSGSPGGSSGQIQYNSSGSFAGIPAGTNGQFLRASTTATSGYDFTTISGSGSVTSVDMSVPTGLAISGNPITTSGTLALSLQAGYNIPLTASTTNWNTFYNTPSNRITAGSGLFWSGNTLTSSLSTSTALTATQVVFATAANTIGTDSNLYWDNVNKALGIGGTPGSEILYVGGKTGINTTTGASTLTLVGSGGINPLTVASSTGTALVTVTQAGNVGIGTTSPILGSKLNVVADENQTSTLYNAQLNLSNVTGTGSFTAGYDNTSGYGFINAYDSVAGAKNLVINRFGGNVGIGTTSPVGLLQVGAMGSSGSRNALVLAADGPRQYFLTDGTHANWKIAAQDSVSNGLTIAVGTANANPVSSTYTDAVTILSNGNVGVGTTNPSAKISLGSDATAQKLLLYESGAIKYGMGIQGSELRVFAPNGANHISFGSVNSTDGTTWNEMMRIDNTNGNVGIGTLSPQAKLDVAGIASSTTFYAGNGAVGTPSYAFSNSTNSGLYWDGTFINFAVGGSRVGYLNASSANLPNLTINAKSNIYSNTNGNFTLGNNANTDFNLLQFGGTTSSYAGLQAASSTAAGGIALKVVGADGTANENLYVTGNVGIGTTSPSQLLTVGNNNQFTVTSAGGASTTHLTVLTNTYLLNVKNTFLATDPNGLIIATTTPTIQLQNLTTNDILFGQGTNVIATSSNFTFNPNSNTLAITGSTTISNLLTVSATSTLASTSITGILSVTGSTTLSSLTAGTLQSTANGNLFVISNTGSGLNVLQTSPTLITPILGVASGTALTLSNNLWVVGTSSTSGQSTMTTASATAISISGNAYIPTLANLPTNGFVKTSGSNGTLSVDTSTYLTSAITSLNGLAGASQTFATSTGGTLWTITSSGTVHTWNIPASPTFTGTSTLSGALIIPNAGASVLGSAGQIAVNTTASTLSFNDGTAQRYLNPIKDFPWTLENAAANEDDSIWMPYATSTIVGVRCINKSFSDSEKFNLIWDNSRATATSSATNLISTFNNCTATTTPSLITSFANTVVNTGQVVRFITATASSSQFTIDIYYRENQ